MRTTIFLLFTCVFCSMAELSYTQNARVTINKRNATIKEILNEIEKQTDYLFIYNDEVNANEKVSVKAKQEAVSSVLNSMLNDKDMNYSMEGNHIILSKSEPSENGNITNVLQQQKKRISGIVLDENGQPIIGANIIEAGTTNGTVTDMDGKFTLQVADNADVQISYIGYLEQIVNTSGKSNIIVTLVEDTKVLDEVLVVGYGTARKSDITGAVVRADLAALQESPNISLLGALQGLVPGLNVGATTSAGSDPSFSIRGRTSISGTTSPLIVLDGIIYRGNIVDINVNDVESIDILKDASATAIYGSQASNGVILITTKTGKTKSKPIISYNGYASYQQPTNKKLVPENREGFLRKIADRFLEESRIGDDMLQMNPDWDPSKHLMDRNALEGYNNGVDTDWWDLLTNDTPYIQSHNMSIRGKSDLNGYFFSVGYLDQENLIINDKYQRYNIRINLDMDVTNWLTVGTQSAFTMSDYSGTTPTLSNVIGLPPIVAVRDSEGQLIKQPYKSVNNPLLEIQEKDLNKRYFMNATFYADIKFPFIEGLNYRINFSQYMRNTKDFNFSDLKQNFQGEGYKANNSEDGWTFDNIVSYKKKFGIHDMDVTLLYGAEKREYESTTARSRIFTNNTLGYNKLSAGQADLQSAESGAWEEASLYSMARLRYTFNDKYTFTGTVRRDGFSGFGENHKFGVFPSAAVAWRINEEEFMKAFEWMDNLKLRLSYGKNGNRTIDRYQTLAKLNSGNGYVYGDGSNAEQRQWLSALANADLKWEVANTFNIGIDFGIMRNRIFGYLDYYTSNTYDLLYNINIPQINGLSSIPSNIGKMGNKGFELSLTAIPIKNRDFSWDITFNYSINRNKVKSILGIDADGDGKEDDLISNKIFIGEPYGVAYDYNIIGMWQLADYHAGIIPSGFTYGTYKIEDIDGDGNYTADKDRKILGYIDPSYRFGIQNTLRYKNWELKMFINSIQGGKNYYYGQPGSALPNPDNIYQNNLFNFDYWTPENPNARYRQLGYYTQTLGYGFSPYVQRSFIRLQDISLSYTVPQSFLEKLNISRLNLFITGKNLITITDWDGWDPETGNGLNTDSLPLMKSYTFGLNFEF